MTDSNSPATSTHDRGALYARCLPFALYMVFLALGDAPAAWFGMADARWLYAWRVGTVAVLLVYFWPRYEELSTGQPPGVFAWMQALGLGGLVWVLWINLDFPPLAFDVSGGGFNPLDDGGGLNLALVSVRIAGAALVVPVMEELFWRSLVMRWLDTSNFRALAPTFISLRALLLSAVAFGLEHGLWFAGILAGLVYGQLYRRHANLWLPIVSHALTNLLLGLWVVHRAQWYFW